MIHKATAMAVRQNLGEFLNGVQYRHDTVLITKAGKPVAALVDIELFEKIRNMRAQFERLTAELGQASSGTAQEEVEAAIKEAIQEIRKG